MRYAITGVAGALRDLGSELAPGNLDNRAALDRPCAGAAGLFDEVWSRVAVVTLEN
jgi:hypothetical protein